MSELKTESSTVTTIVPGRPICTLVNTLTAKPENGKALLEYLREITEKEVKFCPGFISANFHLNEDNTRIVNYTQWRRIEDLYAMLARFPEHVERCRELADHIEISPVLQVVYCAQAADQPQE
jgi:quinol monooxygenase YgiN